jgi:hypothetical protein
MADLHALLAHVDEVEKVLNDLDPSAAPEVLMARRDCEDLKFNLNKLAEEGLLDNPLEEGI